MGGPRRPKTGGGTRAGKPNHLTRDLRAMIEGALHAVGGQAYLEKQAKKNPKAFMALVGRILPKDINVTTNHAAPRVIDSSKLSYDERQQLRDMILRAALPEQPAIEHEDGSVAAQEGLGAAIAQPAGGDGAVPDEIDVNASSD